MSSISVNTLSTLYERVTGKAPQSVTSIAGSGSARQYYRISGIVKAVGVAGVSREENQRYLLISEALKRNGLPVPDVLASACGAFEDQYYLLRDCGETSVFDLISKGDAKDKVVESMTLLAKMHSDSNLLSSIAKCIDIKKLSDVVNFDLNYFKYEFLKPCEIDFDEFALEKDFHELRRRIEQIDDDVLVYRDFQSRNVLVDNDGNLTLIDFQGALRGPGLYDVVSFLYQAKAGFTSDFREQMLATYFMKRYGRLLSEKDRSNIALLSLVRNLQVLGAYGFRGLVQRKSHFLGSIKPALRNLAGLLRDGAADGLSELKRVALALCDDYRFQDTDTSGLVVTVQSFSYKLGYPEDLSGNGGGFVFDCRALHNPGRYNEFKMLTGADAPVVDFLEEKGEVQPFLKAAEALVVPAVRRYLDRGFTSLQVSFGCTGGRHRSVYCAEKMASLLASIFSEATIVLVHREQGIRKEVNV